MLPKRDPIVGYYRLMNTCHGSFDILDFLLVCPFRLLLPCVLVEHKFLSVTYFPEVVMLDQVSALPSYVPNIVAKGCTVHSD
jgi:hypothetical protein